MTFPVIGAFLRLGNKYEIPELQRAAISRLRACFPDRLKDFRNAETTAQCAETEDEDEDMDEEDLKFNPPLIYMCLEEVIGVIDLARTHNLPSLLPAAFYLISCLPPEIVVKGGGQDRDGKRLLLSQGDIVKTLAGSKQLVQRELAAIPKMSRVVAKAARGKCVETCALSNVLQSTHADWGSLMGNLGESLYEDRLHPYLDGVCPKCHARINAQWQHFRELTWSSLREIFSLDEDVVDGST